MRERMTFIGTADAVYFFPSVIYNKINHYRGELTDHFILANAPRFYLFKRGF